MEKITRPGGDGLFILSDDDLPSLNVSFTDFRYGTSRAKSAVLRLFTGAETEDVPKVTVHLNVKADQIDANHMMLRIIRDTKNRHPKRTRINFSFRDLAEDIAVSDEEDLPFGFTERTSDEDDDWSRFFDTDSEYPDEDEDRDYRPRNNGRNLNRGSEDSLPFDFPKAPATPFELPPEYIEEPAPSIMNIREWKAHLAHQHGIPFVHTGSVYGIFTRYLPSVTAFAKATEGMRLNSSLYYDSLDRSYYLCIDYEGSDREDYFRAYNYAGEFGTRTHPSVPYYKEYFRCLSEHDALEALRTLA